MKQFPPNLDPKVYTISAILIGFALLDDFTAAEQNAIGNWFITVGQVLENNSAWQQMVEARIQGNIININSKQYKETGNPFMDGVNTSNKQIDDLSKAIKKMQEELDKLRQEKKN